MIGDGQFAAQLNAIESLLNDLDLLERRERFPNKSLGAAKFKRLTYRQVYEESLRESAYDFKLIDHSLLLFTKSGSDQHDGALNFSFLECPIEVPSFRAYVSEFSGVLITDPNFELYFEQWQDELRAEYDDVLSNLDSKLVVTPIRYDFKSSQYTPGLHPASHVHFGYKNDIRVATVNVMNPISFTLMIVRQRFPDQWIQFLDRPDVVIVCRNVREQLDRVASAYWGPLDDYELCLQ